MASFANILICGVAAVLIYACLGLPLALKVVQRPLAIALAPALGWAVHSVVALPLCFVMGLDRPAVIAVFAVPLAVALVALWRGRKGAGGEGGLTLPYILALGGAALLALVVMAAVVPKFSADGVTLAAPIFDHSKIAMIDEMTRLGVPPGNPFFGGVGSPARLSYYYLWHFSAAELSTLFGISGWEADGGLSFFTGFASLAVLIGLAVWLSGRARAGLWLVALAATASMRPLLNWPFGRDAAETIIGYESGFGGWLFQTSWAPQHTAAATLAIVSILLLADIARQPRVLTTLLFALTMAAGFETSTWVGGIAFPLAAIPVALAMLIRAEPRARVRIVLCFAVAAALALLLMSPFVYDQLHMAALRGDGPPVVFHPNDIFGDDVSDWLDDNIGEGVAFVLNGLAQWLIYLPVEYPAFYPAGLVALYVLLRDRALTPERRSIVIAFALTLAASLCASWLLVSTLGENNDLGWRAVLPGMMLLMVLTAAGLSRLTFQRFSAPAVAAIVLILLGVPAAIQFGFGNVVVPPNVASKGFAASPALWQAVRRVTPADERVANNPSYMEHATPWGVNISWALLADRRSCYAGPGLVGPFSGLSKAHENAIDTQFSRVFAGKAEAGDVAQLATEFKCKTAVVAPTDGAWSNDPFAASRFYRLVEGTPDWRIYRAVTSASQ